MTDAFSPLGLDLFGDPVRVDGGAVADRFIMPPFTVLDSTAPDWQHRRRGWRAAIPGGMGGGGVGVVAHDTGGPDDDFDPVLAELVHSWWCPPRGVVADPFAYSATRGAAAALHGYGYIGTDLRPAVADKARRLQDARGWSRRAQWVTASALSQPPGGLHDLLWVVPPVPGGDDVLGRPTDDLTAMDPHAYAGALGRVLLAWCKVLREHRFVVAVIEERQHADGSIDDVGSVLQGIAAAIGLSLYNEAAVLTHPYARHRRRKGGGDDAIATGLTAGLRCSHVQILTWVKGDWRKAAAACRGEQ